MGRLTREYTGHAQRPCPAQSPTLISAAINGQLPSVTEEFEVELVTIAIEDDLASSYDRGETAEWTVEGEPFALCVRLTKSAEESVRSGAPPRYPYRRRPAFWSRNCVDVRSTPRP